MEARASQFAVRGLTSRSRRTASPPLNSSVRSKGWSMGINLSQSSRQYLWWIYLTYITICLAWKSYALLISNHQYMVFMSLAIFLDVLGLFCLYCFIRKIPSFSRRFWILFSIFYLFKLTINVILFCYIAFAFPWSQGNANNRLTFNFMTLIFGAPLVIAIVKYAFYSKAIWSVREAITART